MLPSRLFRNTGLPPALRSLLIPSPSLPSTYNVQLRFRLGIAVPAAAAPQRSRYSTGSSSSSSSSPPPPSSSSSTLNLGEKEKTTTQETEEVTVAGRQAVGKIEPRLSITFTCTVERCGRRSTHEFTKHAYEKGIVLIQCPGCKNRHLIADHLGWFKDSTGDGKMRTVEDLLKAKGEAVKRGKIDPDSGTIELV